ncbi:MAG: NADPH:quinone reductase [Spirochaetales bacterium]|nr:NADPH:quinone reductase [Spirochaetales bacterium]
MKRIVVRSYGSPDQLTLEDSQPPSPGPGQVLVHLSAAGVNPVDTYRRAGTQGYTPDLPFTPGFEGAGVVAAVGADGQPVSAGQGTPAAKGNPAPALVVGQRVYVGWSVSGTYGQWCIADRSQVFALPPSLSFFQGAGLFVPYFTAYRGMVFRGGVQKGAKVLIHGASGGVGSAALFWASYLGLLAWGTAGSSEGVQRVLNQGALGCWNHRYPGYWVIMAREVGRFDLILEMNAHTNLQGDLGLLSPAGRVMVVGSRGDIAITPRRLMGIEGDIRGVVLAKNTGEENHLTAVELERALEQGGHIPEPRVFPLSQASEVHRLVESGEASSGKMVLDCR